MQITLELPEDIAQGMESKWKDLPRAALESLALEAYRSHQQRSHSPAAVHPMPSRPLSYAGS